MTMKKNVLLLGGNGYIGSKFFLDNLDHYNIVSIDLNWFCDPRKNEKSIDFNTLSTSFINKFDSVILLAGHSSVKMCEHDMTSSFENNVSNFIHLLDKISSNQKLIYASSSSVYGNTDQKIVDETYKTYSPFNYYDTTKQVIDLYSIQSGKNFYGLRFGTVNGWSPHMRVDIMINAMVNSALQNKKIDLYYPETNRAILGINDLSKALCRIIDNDNDTLSGIYNLASFNSTSGQIAYKVSEILGIPVDDKTSMVQLNSHSKLTSNSYDFSINSGKFEKAFNFHFSETIDSIVKDLVSGIDNMKTQKTRRDMKVNYGKI